MLLLLPLLLISTLVRAEQLPAQWLGKYQLETSEGFTAFMTEIGVNWFTRQVDSFNFTLSLLIAQDCVRPLPDSDEQEPGREQGGH